MQSNPTIRVSVVYQFEIVVSQFESELEIL